jgi:hypothetical protein
MVSSLLIISRSCIRCRDDFSKNKALHNLPCSHIYCDACLRGLVTMAMQEETKMPPKCCQKPIPAFIVKSVLNDTQQQIFMKRVLQFATPTEERIFCPKSACREFIPKPGRVDPKHPCAVECKRCHVRVCKQCKKVAHASGRGCPGVSHLRSIGIVHTDLYRTGSLKLFHRWEKRQNGEGATNASASSHSPPVKHTCPAHVMHNSATSVVPYGTNALDVPTIAMERKKLGGRR